MEAGLLRQLARGAPADPREYAVGHANPSAGHDFTITVPGSKVWIPVALKATLTAAVSVHNRNAIVQVGDGTQIVAEQASAFNVTSGQAVRHSWLWDYRAAVEDPNDVVITQPIPEMILRPAWTIGTTTANLQATDQWSAITLVVVEFYTGENVARSAVADQIELHSQALVELLTVGA